MYSSFLFLYSKRILHEGSVSSPRMQFYCFKEGWIAVPNGDGTQFYAGSNFEVEIIYVGHVEKLASVN